MRKKVLVRGPVLTRSGYGEHARLVCRALKSREDLFDIYIIPVNWGETGWIWNNDEERKWIDERIQAAAEYGESGGNFDMSVQVTIPNEWEKMAPVNIGITAGIETTKVSPVWLEKANMMDKVLTISEHSRAGLVNSIYHGKNVQTGQPMTLKCTAPVGVINYPYKEYKESEELELNLDYDFNFLVVAQDGPRKNIRNTIKWFVEENFDQEVGLVVKTFIKNGCINDRIFMEKNLKDLLASFPERSCKVYLLHGDMTDAEMHSLYKHPQIKSLISLTHGEGYGLPLFEAAYSALPVIAPGWSGQCDFLYAPFQESKKKKTKPSMHPYFAEVEYTLGPIPENAVWKGVLEKESMWCYPQEGSYKMRIRQVRKNYNKWEKKAITLQKWIFENFSEDKIYKKYVEEISSFKTDTMSDEDVNDLFSEIMG